jgi:DNA-binding transcriptional ArsR family regulator
MSAVDDRFVAMAHPGRRAMVSSSLAGERSASDLAVVAGLSRPAASQHLGKLVAAGLLRVRSEGRHRWYRADPMALDELRSELAVFWETRLDELRWRVEE